MGTSRSLCILRWVVILALVAFCTGCSHHGSSDDASATVESEDTLCTANGRIVLPAGSTLAMSDLTVMGCMASVTPDSDGNFSVQEPDSGPALVMVKDKDGNPVLMGFVDGVDANVATINAKSTATAILFQQLCAYTIMPSAWKSALAVIEADSHTDTLAGVIATRLAADPAALGNQDAEIRAALVAAAEAVLPEAMRSSASFTIDEDDTSSEAASSAVSMVTLTKSSTLVQSVAAITVTSTATQSGIQVGAYPDGDGVILTNNYRRHVWYYVYITGYQNADGEDVKYSLDSWVEVTNGYLPSTNALSGIFGSTIDSLWDNVAYKPVSTAPIEVTFQPSTAKKMYLAVVTAGAGTNSLDLPSAIAGSTNATAWGTAKLDMQAVTLIKDFVLPAVFTFVPAKALGSLNGRQLSDLSWEIIGACTQAGFDAGTSIAGNDWWGAFKTVVKGIATDENLRKSLGNIIATRVLAKYASEETATLIGNSATLLMKVVKGFDLAFLGIDYVAVATSCAYSDTYNYFTYTGSQPTVRIEPDPATVHPGMTVDLTTYKDIADSGSYTYTYKTAGNHGTLSSGTQSGTSFETSNETVTYICNPDAQAGDTETVEVTVYRHLTTDSGYRSDLVGEASVTITMTAPALIINPSSSQIGAGSTNGFTAYYDGAVSTNTLMRYRWTNTGKAGHLLDGTGASTDTYESSSASTTYVAGSSDGNDTLTVEFLMVWDGALYSLGSAQAAITVGDGNYTTNGQKRIIWETIPSQYDTSSYYDYACVYLIVWTKPSTAYPYYKITLNTNSNDLTDEEHNLWPGGPYLDGQSVYSTTSSGVYDRATLNAYFTSRLADFPVGAELMDLLSDNEQAIMYWSSQGYIPNWNTYPYTRFYEIWTEYSDGWTYDIVGSMTSLE